MPALGAASPASIVLLAGRRSTQHQAAVIGSRIDISNWIWQTLP